MPVFCHGHKHKHQAMFHKEPFGRRRQEVGDDSRAKQVRLFCRRQLFKCSVNQKLAILIY